MNFVVVDNNDLNNINDINDDNDTNINLTLS